VIAASSVTNRERPIGVFDSGVGGVSVLREIRRVLPAEDLIYLADSAYTPYGDRPATVITERSIAMVALLQAADVKAVVVACNTATGIAVDALRARFTMPIIAIEPAVKPAAARTRSGVVGVLATTQTLASQRFWKLVETHAAGVRVVTQPSPGLVERVEAGELSTAATRSLVEQYVKPLLDNGADTIVLGCTHYPFLSAVIQDVAGPSITVIDPAVAVARELRRRLEAGNLLAPDTRTGGERFWTTGPADQSQAVIGQLWGSLVEVTRVAAA
jgi:glutamate racemase